jgi:hypothetical protein
MLFTTGSSHTLAGLSPVIAQMLAVIRLATLSTGLPMGPAGSVSPSAICA